MAADVAILEIATGLTGAVGGAVGTFVALRTRLALMQRDIIAEQEARERLAITLDTHVNRADRRTYMMLQLLVDIARKVGVENRLGDAIVTMMGDDLDANNRGMG